MKNKINQFDSDGEKTGRWEVWFVCNWAANCNGHLGSRGNYEKGKRHGFWEEFWENGENQCRGNFEAGAQIGLWECFDKKGVLVKKRFHGRTSE